jgi:D-glycero-alpha-D-manno-heptose-7-phosphate kinase
MIITRTPYRISLFGGSSDYPSYYQRYGSLLLGFAIDKYVYISLRKNYHLFNYNTRVTYSIIESVNENSSIQNPGVKGTLEYEKVEDPLTINIQGDLPARTGIGSSSSMVVGLLNCIDVYRHLPPNKRSLAQRAIAIEREVLKEPGGIQDQIWAAYGGVNTIEINQGGEFTVRPLPVSVEFLEKLRQRMVLCHTGFARNSFGIAASHDNTSNVGIKGQMKEVAKQAVVAFKIEDIDEIGRLLHKSWRLKRSVSGQISSEYIDTIYDRGIESGALGGKLLGSGGNGFMLFLLDKHTSREQFCTDIKLEHIDFNYSYGGSEVLLTNGDN